VLDIWTKGTTFPRECLDELERQLAAASAPGPEPVHESTTPPFSPALPPLELKKEGSNGGLTNGQGKYRALSIAFVVCSRARICRGASPTRPARHRTRSTAGKRDHPGKPTPTTDPRHTSPIYILLCLIPTPGMHPLRRRAVIRRTHKSHEHRLHDVLPGDSACRRARRTAHRSVRGMSVVHGHKHGMSAPALRGPGRVRGVGRH
jgi:hypothetical protein